MSGITTTVVPTTVTTVSDTREYDLVVVAPLIVTDTSQDEIVTTVSAAEIQTTVAGTYASLVVVGSTVVTTLTASQGPQGVPGESGGSIIAYVAGETISALKVVVVIGDNAFVADSTDSAHRGRVAGIAATAATIGNTGDVRAFGQMTDASWNWTGPLLFFNSSGTLTETPPASGFSQSVARVESADTIFVDLTQAIERA